MRILIVLIYLIGLALHADNWSDLDEGETPIYGSEKESKMPINAFFVEREKWEEHSSLHIFWIFKTTDYPRYTAFRLFPFYHNQTSKIDNRARTFLPVLLTYFSIVGDEKYFFSPLYTASQIGDTRSSKSALFLFWWGNQRGEDFESSHLYSPLLNYKFRKSSSTVWFPLLPVTYHRVTSSEGHRNFLWLLDYAWLRKDNQDSLYRLWLLPLFIWGKDATSGYSASLLHYYIQYNRSDDTTQTSWGFPIIPVYAQNTNDSQTTYRWLFPFFHYSHSGVMKELITPIFYYEDDISNTLVISLLHGRATSTLENYSAKSLWFPIIPLYAHHYENNEVKLQWLFPLWYREKSEYNSDFYSLLYAVQSSKNNQSFWLPILPLFYKAHYQSETYQNSLVWLFPLFFSAKTVHENAESKDFYTPLWGYERSPQKKSFWFPLIPLYYHGTDGEFSHKNLLWLYDTKSDREGLLKLWVVPFFFWEKNQYFIAAPFYISTPQPSGVTKHYGIFHYYHKTQDFKTLWVLPYFTSESESRGTNFSLIVPVWLYYRNTGWQTEVIFPWSFYYGDPDYQLYLHISGVSQKANVTRVPSEDSTQSDSVYLDTDFSWLYNMFSISARTDVVGLNNDVKAEKPLEIREAPQITQRKKFNREDSTSFFGIQLFYGLAAWERADTKRHFRLLPLSWLTWDTASADQLTAFPPVYFYYNSEPEKVSYMAIVPFYGKQTSGASYRQAWLLTAFWNEYDENENRRESDILWPLINWHSSDKKSGFRMLPFYYQKTTLQDGYTFRQKMSPLFYYSEKIHTPKPETQPANSTRNEVPDTQDNTPESDILQKEIPESVPEEKPPVRVSHLNIGLLYDKTERDEYHTTWVFPLYYKQNTRTHDTIFLLGYYRKKPLGQSNGLTLAPPFYIGYSDNSEQTGIYGLWLWWNQKELQNKRTENTVLWPIINWYTAVHGHGSRFLPLYYYRNSGSGTHLNVLLLYDKQNQPEKSSLWITPFFYRGYQKEDTRQFTLGYYYSRDKYSTLVNFMYLYEKETGEDFHSVGWFLSLLNYRTSTNHFRITGVYSLGFSYTKSPYENHYDFSAGIFLITAKRNEYRFTHSVFPLWDYTSYENSWKMWSIATASYFKYDKEYQFYLALLGLAYFKNSSPDTEWHMVLGGTLWHERRLPERKYHSRGMFWGILWDYETEEETGFKKFSILKGLYKRIVSSEGVRQKFLWIL